MLVMDSLLFESKAGEIFKVRSIPGNAKEGTVTSSGGNYVVVDGYVAQNDKRRFCLGALSNVHRYSFCMYMYTCIIIWNYK